jgi:tRNA-Thr(GGU) m(6)t(6)A37 methyltransferase TsaA
VALARTPFREKFAIPRQAALLRHTRARIEFRDLHHAREALRGLEAFTHLWVISWMHLAEDRGPSVRPPRLGGNARIGVWACRSPFRPNPIGLSLCRILRVDAAAGLLEVAGLDLVDRSPILDLKPFIPYADSAPGADGAWTSDGAPKPLQVGFSAAAEAVVANSRIPELRASLVEILGQDPRPAYHDDPERIYGVALYDWNLRFQVKSGELQVLEMLKLE